MTLRPYKVVDKTTSEITYLIAATPAQAIHFCVKSRFTAEPLSALEVATLPPGTQILNPKAEATNDV